MRLAECLQKNMRDRTPNDNRISRFNLTQLQKCSSLPSMFEGKVHKHQSVGNMIIKVNTIKHFIVYMSYTCISSITS